MRNRTLNFVITDQLDAVVREEAAKHHQTASEWVRTCIIQRLERELSTVRLGFLKRLMGDLAKRGLDWDFREQVRDTTEDILSGMSPEAIKAKTDPEQTTDAEFAAIVSSFLTLTAQGATK